MKRLLAFFLAAVMVFGMTACFRTPAPEETQAPTEARIEEPQETVGMPNPVVTVGSYAELCQVSPEVQIADAPKDATNVRYSWLQNIPVIKQIDFSFEGHEFTLRAMANATGAIATDISGVYTPMDATSSVAVGGTNVAGGSYILQYNTENGSGIASWISDLNKCQYSLYTPTGCKDFVINKVVEEVYTCTANAKQVTGTVQMVTSKTLTLTLVSGETVVLDCSAISNVSVNPADVVTVDYLGDLKGAAQALKIQNSGHDETQKISGTVQAIEGSDMFVKTSDGNVYLFHITTKTKISGAADHVTKGAEVQVSYEGKLGWEDTYALDVNIVKVGTEPKPTPSPNYTNHTTSGFITSVAGNYICVNGMTFYIDKSSCTVSGSMKVDYWADLSYRKFDNGTIQVYKAVFTNKNPQKDYTLRTTYGTITSLTESPSNKFYKMVVNGDTFVVHYNVIFEGSPRMGDDADLHYKDYGNGTFEVTEAHFYQTSPGWTWKQVYGKITRVNGNYVSIEGKEYLVPAYTVHEGTATVGGFATLYLKVYNNGNQEVDEAHFFPPEPDPITYEDKNIYGTVDSINGTMMRVQGMSIEIPSNYSGTPIVGGTVDLTERYYSDGTRTTLSCTFYAPVEPGYHDEDIIGTISSINGTMMRVQGMSVEIPSNHTGTPEEGGTVDMTRRVYDDGRIEILHCDFQPAVHDEPAIMDNPNSHDQGDSTEPTAQEDNNGQESNS